MTNLKVPEDLDIIRERVLNVLSPIRQADEQTKAEKNFLFTAKKTDSSRLLPPHQLVYFLFYSLLGFKNLGRFEKVAWSIPIEFNGKAFLIEHRKFGIGVFASDLDRDETDAKEIVKKICKAVKIAKPYFEWLASKAVAESKFNVNNECEKLFRRYKYLRDLYRKESKNAEERKDEVHKETTQTKDGTATHYYFPYFELRQNANWLAISTIEAFFSWTEHLFIHLAIIAKGLSDGNEVANLIEAEWQIKFKSAISLKNQEAKKYFDELILVRRQLRNFIAHGAFGKNGEAFHFHSSAGAVPIRILHEKGKNQFALTSEIAFDEDSVLKLLANFISYLWTSNISPAMFYLHKTGLPTILTMAQDGQYSKAMMSRENMKALIEYLCYLSDQAANMDW